jgi:hypothetical protein
MIISTESFLGGAVFASVAFASAATLCIIFSYTLGQRIPEWRGQTGSTWLGPKQDTSEERVIEGDAQQPKKSDKASKPTPKPEEPKPEEPITVKSTTCLVKEVRTSEPRVSTAETSELLVTLAVPSNARECRDTVTVDAPTFGLGKAATQPVAVVRPQESQRARWLLDPEKPGTWNIAVETTRDRELVPVAVTTPLGFTATWAQAGALIAGVATIIFGVLHFLRRS